MKQIIAVDAQANPELEKVISESLVAYKQGRTMTTEELKQFLSPKDFEK